MRVRKGLVYLGAAAVIVSAAACGDGEQEQSGGNGDTRVLRIASFGGSFQEALDTLVVRPISSTLGIQATVEAYGGEYDRLAATIQDGTNPFDLVHVESRFVVQAAERGLSAPIDWNVVPRAAFVDGATTDNAIGMLSWALVLAWNGDRLPRGAEPPSTWADFFDLNKYPGPRALRNTAEGNLEIALLADGVSPSTLAAGDLDVARALRKFDSIKGSIVWWSSGAELEQRLGSSAALAAAWNGRAAHLKNVAGEPVGWTFDQSISQFDWWIIPANSPNKDLALRFLAETGKGIGQVEIARQFGLE